MRYSIKFTYLIMYVVADKPDREVDRRIFFAEVNAGKSAMLFDEHDNKVSFDHVAAKQAGLLRQSLILATTPALGLAAAKTAIANANRPSIGCNKIVVEAELL